MAGFPQAPDPVWASRVRKDDDAHVNAASHAEPRLGQPEFLELHRSQPHTAGDSTILCIIGWLRIAAVEFDERCACWPLKSVSCGVLSLYAVSRWYHCDILGQQYPLPLCITFVCGSACHSSRVFLRSLMAQ